MKHEEDYAIRRYVDNYYVFANSEERLLRIQRRIEKCLAEFKLHLNEAKSESFDRPFITARSFVTSKADHCLDIFLNKILESVMIDGKRALRPRGFIRIHHAMVRSFVTDIKDICYEGQLGYESLTNYIVGALCKRVN